MKSFLDYDKPLLIKLIILKAVTLVISVFVTLIVWRYFEVDLPLDSMLIILGASVLILLLWCLRLKFDFPVGQAEIFLLLMSDIIVLFFLISQSGGSANPFTSSLLVPLALSAALLQKRYSISVVLVSLALYAYWTFGQGSHMHHMDHSAFSLHLYGMWINFLLSALILFVFVAFAMESVKKRDQQLNKVREKVIRDEQLVAIATLTATTAHALGTPLSTMSILVEEWELDEGLDDEHKILKEQLKICKKHLSNIQASVKASRASDILVEDISSIYLGLEEHFMLLRPTDHLSLDCDELLDGKCIRHNRSLTLALINLIENSLEVSKKETQVRFYCDTETLSIDIIDDGIGISPEVRDKLGQPFISTKKEGWGLGIYLSNSTIESFGGNIVMQDNPAGGTITRVILPLTDEK